MKANELRIGNFYSQFGNVHETSFFTIETLTKAPKQQLWCKPIPITEEWLLKFGWVKGDFDDEYLNNVSLKQEVLNYNVISKILCIESNKDIIEINHIKYIHQLQNLYFALTGKELIIK